MQTKFVKLKLGEVVHYVNPVFVTSVLKTGDKCVVYTMDGRSAYSDEAADEVVKKIKEANEFKITLDKQIL